MQTKKEKKEHAVVWKIALSVQLTAQDRKRDK